MRRYRKNNEATPGLGVVDVIQIILIVLKLLRVIDWSWWVVLIPTWIVLGIIFVLAIVLAIVEHHENKT